jgi:autotransporter-associated beta strand protein
VGNSANGPAASTSSLGLGQTNTLNTGTLTIGAYRGNGSVAFQPDVTGGTLTLRGSAGGDSRVDNVYVGYKSGGDNFGKGVLDVSAGSIDARVTNFTIGQYIVYASSNQTGTFSMTSGTLDTTTLTLGTVIVSTGSVGTPPISSIFNQAGGTVKAATAVFGNNAGTAGVGNAPTFASVYNLSSGTLALGSLAAGAGTSGTGSQRLLNWNGGTIATYDAATDLTMSGTSGAGGALIVTLGGSDPKTFDIEAGRTATLGDYVTLTGSAGFTKAGAGTLVVGSQTGATATYAGPTTVVGGTLVLATGSAVGSSPIAVAAGATARIAGYTSTTLAGLDLSANGLMDVTTGLLTISSGMTAPQLVAELLEGRGDGSWNGTSGITSSVAAAEVALNIPRAVGWLDNGDGSMTVAYAAPGDTNIDWVVDIIDVANFLTPGKFNTGAPATWLEGDFNYDGIVDILDASGFLSTGLYDVGSYNTPPAVGGIAAVPEPSAWALVGAGIVAAVAARRRRGLMS